MIINGSNSGQAVLVLLRSDGQTLIFIRASIKGTILVLIGILKEQ